MSAKLLQDLNENEIPILRATEIPIGRILAKSLQKIPPPKYYVLEAEPGLEIWSEKIPIEEQIAAKNESPPRFLLPSRTKCKADSWNGLDLFSNSGGLIKTVLYCTDRVKDLAEKKGWTNVKSDQLEAL